MTPLDESKSVDPDRERLTRRILRVCEAVGAFIEWWGFKSIHGQIWVLLCASSRPLFQREIASLLGVSRSLVSTAIAELAGYRLVEATGEQRHAPYVAKLDVWPTISDVLRTREWIILEHVRQALDGAVEEAERQRRAGAAGLAFDAGRLALLLRMTEVAQMLLRMLIALGGAQLPRGFGAWLGRAMDLTNDLRAQERKR